MGVALEHLEGAVAHGGGEFEVGGALRGGEGGEGVAHVVDAAVGDSGAAEGFLPGFFDVYAAESGPAGKDKWFGGLAGIEEGEELFGNGLRE